MTRAIRVLLVDDQPLFRSGVAVSLAADPGLEVVGEASDGFEALRLIEDTQPDVVLMDVRMPELDGVETTRRIFAPSAVAARAHAVKVIVLTTFNLDERAAAAIRYGASGFLLKDASPEFLRAAIRTVHAGSAVLTPDDLEALMEGGARGAIPLPAAYETLTEREREVLLCVAEGLSNAEIASRLYSSESTVKTHVGAVLRKLGLRDRVQVVVFAFEHGLRG